MRANVFIGFKKILTKERSHRIIKDFLPNFANSIYDEDSAVLEALIKLLWHAENQVGMPFWDVVPLTYILDRLEVEPRNAQAFINGNYNEYCISDYRRYIFVTRVDKTCLVAYIFELRREP